MGQLPMTDDRALPCWLLEFWASGCGSLAEKPCTWSSPKTPQHCAATASVSTAFGSVRSGACAFVGRMKARATWSSWIITKGELT